MRTRYFTLGLTLLMLTGIVSYAEAKTRHLKCTQSNTFTDGVETRIDTNGDSASATLSQGIANCNGSSSFVQEEAEWIFQPTLTDCPNVPNMFEFHISQTQGQHRAIGTDLKTGDQTFAKITSGTLCITSTGIITGTTEGIYIGGTGKNTGATGAFESYFSGRYLAFGCKDGLCGGFGQSTATIKATLILPDGND